MKKVLDSALASKERQRKESAARPVAEKLRTLDRMLERSKLLRGARARVPKSAEPSRGMGDTSYDL